MAIELKIVVVDSETSTGAKVIEVADPESGVIGSVGLAVDA